MNIAKHYPRIADALYNRPWLILPTVHNTLVQTFEAHRNQLGGASVRKIADEHRKAVGKPRADDNPDTDSMEELLATPKQVIDLPSNVALVTIEGIIGKHLAGLDLLCGGCDLNNVSANIDTAMENANVDTILFYANSPGGTVTGVPELAEKIAEVSKTKKTICYVDMLCASAGYYLASQCDTILSAPSADLGSVGVYSIYTDYTRAYDKEGITVNAISAGTHKLDGASFKVMSDEVKAIFQADVDRIYKDFKEAVTSKRSIKDEDLQGQCFSGPDLIEKGFCDGFINDFKELAQSLKAQST